MEENINAIFAKFCLETNGSPIITLLRSLKDFLIFVIKDQSVLYWFQALFFVETFQHLTQVQSLAHIQDVMRYDLSWLTRYGHFFVYFSTCFTIFATTADCVMFNGRPSLGSSTHFSAILILCIVVWQCHLMEIPHHTLFIDLHRLFLNISLKMEEIDHNSKCNLVYHLVSVSVSCHRT